MWNSSYTSSDIYSKQLILHLGKWKMIIRKVELKLSTRTGRAILCYFLLLTILPFSLPSIIQDKSLYHPISNSCIDSSPNERRIFMNTCDPSSLTQQWLFEKTNATVLEHFNQGANWGPAASKRKDSRRTQTWIGCCCCCKMGYYIYSGSPFNLTLRWQLFLFGMLRVRQDEIPRGKLVKHIS